MIVIATKNPNKLIEFKEILKDSNIKVKSLADFGPIPEVIEDGDTFDANAYKKAYHTARVLGLPAIADGPNADRARHQVPRPILVVSGFCAPAQRA